MIRFINVAASPRVSSCFAVSSFVCAFVFLPCPVLQAQERHQQPQETQKQSSAPLEITLTPHRQPLDINRTGTAISIVTSEEITQTNPATLADVLRRVPGVHVTENGGAGSVTAVSLRGASIGQTLVLIDGVRVNDPSSPSGAFDFSNLAPGLVDRIEVLRGPQTALYGSDAIGGVINILTKRAKSGSHGYGQIEAGRYGSYATNAGIYGKTEDWDYAGAVSLHKNEGFSRYGYRIKRLQSAAPFEKDGFDREGGFFRLGHDAGKGFRFSFSSLLTNLNSNYDAAFGDKPDTPSKLKNLFYINALKAELDTFDGLIQHQITLSNSKTERKDRAFSSFFGDDYVDVYRYIGRRMGGEYQMKITPPASGGFSWGNVILGGKLEREEMESFYEALSPFPMEQTRDLNKGQSSRAIFALWSLPLGENLTLSLGGRIDSIRKSDTFRTFRATLAYQLPEIAGVKSVMRSSFGSGGKAPTLYQLYAPFYGNADLKAERALGGDVGLDQTFFKGRLKTSIGYFFNHTRRMIDYDFVSSRYINVARARAEGVEGSADFEVWPEYLSAFGRFTLLHAIDENSGKRLSRRPQESASMGLSIKFSPQWRLDPSLTFTGKRFSGTGETQRLSPYARLDALLTYSPHKDFSLYIRGENLTNKRYEEVSNYGSAGRGFYAGLRGQW